MSIEPLYKLSLVGLIEDKKKVLSALQKLGCLHLIPLSEITERPTGVGPSPQAYEALSFLLSSPFKRKQIKNAKEFNAADLQDQVLDLQKKILALRDERDYLSKQINDLTPWGDFKLTSLEYIQDQRLWFYIVPHYRMPLVEATELTWQVVQRDRRYTYVAVIATKEPDTMPVPRTHLGCYSLSECKARLDHVESELDDAETERYTLTRWCFLFAKSIDWLEDQATLAHANTLTLNNASLFAVQAWVPVKHVEQLRQFARQYKLILQLNKPGAHETPPTLMTNPPTLAAGEDLVNFYMTPGYHTWDPSPVIFISFTLFFSMILADAGYALILAMILIYFWQRMGNTRVGSRMRTLFAFLVAGTFCYGVITASYFGVALAPDSFLKQIQLLDLTDAPTMMTLSIFIGAIHIILANSMDAWRLRRGVEAFEPLGWALATLGGLLLAAVKLQGYRSMTLTAITLMSSGGLMILLFSGIGLKPLPRFLSGLLAFTKITNVFGDVMSYLRLFALGLATASLATAFNNMAMQARQDNPGLGLLLAILILILGHTMNFVLGLMSSVVHGLRLNVIEFFNWGLKEEGTLFQTFKRKETVSWNR